MRFCKAVNHTVTTDRILRNSTIIDSRFQLKAIEKNSKAKIGVPKIVNNLSQVKWLETSWDRISTGSGTSKSPLSCTARKTVESDIKFQHIAKLNHTL